MKRRARRGMVEVGPSGRDEAGTPVSVLMVAGFDRIGGDVRMYLLAPARLRSSAEIHVHAVVAEDGETAAALRAAPAVTTHRMPLGSIETSRGRSRLARAVEGAVAIARLVRLVRAESIDVVFAIDRGVSMRLAYATALVTRRPLILQMHHTHYLETEPFWRRVIASSAVVSMTTEWMRGYAEPFLASDTTAVVIPNAVTLDEFRPRAREPELLAELGVPLDAPVITLAGRLAVYKGQLDLVEAVADISDEYPDAHVLLVGGIGGNDGSNAFAAQVRERAGQLGLADRVHLLGWRTDVDRIFAASTVVTMPSHVEAFGLVAAEAMAMQRPVIACAEGGVPEFIEDRVTGHLFPGGDVDALAARLRAVLGDPTSAEAMAARARAYVEAHLAPDSYAAAVQALWRAGVERRCPRLRIR